MSLTDSLRYQLKGSAVSSRSYLHKVAPTNGSSFVPGGVTRIDIPSGMRNTYMDPSQTWLEFVVTPDLTTATIAQLDGSAHSLIRKIEVFSSAGSNLLESIDNYGVLYQACANVVSDVDDMCSSGSVCEGYNAPAFSTNSTPGAIATVPFLVQVTDNVKAREVSGMPLTEGLAYTFQLPLMCLVGTLGDKYIPVHALAADLRVEITWQTGISAMVTVNDGPSTAVGASGTPVVSNIGTLNPVYTPGTTGTITAPTAITYTVTNVYLHATMVQVSDDAQAAIDAMTGGIYVSLFGWPLCDGASRPRRRWWHRFGLHFWFIYVTLCTHPRAFLIRLSDLERDVARTALRFDTDSLVPFHLVLSFAFKIHRPGTECHGVIFRRRSRRTLAPTTSASSFPLGTRA